MDDVCLCFAVFASQVARRQSWVSCFSDLQHLMLELRTGFPGQQKSFYCLASSELSWAYILYVLLAKTNNIHENAACQTWNERLTCAHFTHNANANFMLMFLLYATSCFAAMTSSQAGTIINLMLKMFAIMQWLVLNIRIRLDTILLTYLILYFFIIGWNIGVIYQRCRVELVTPGVINKNVIKMLFVLT